MANKFLPLGILTTLLFFLGCTAEAPSSVEDIATPTLAQEDSAPLIELGSTVIDTREVKSMQQDTPQSANQDVSQLQYSATISTDSSDTTIEDNLRSLKVVASGDAHDLKWSEDSSKLVYVIQGEVFEYDLESGNTVAVPSIAHETPTSPFENQLPTDAKSVGLSPSGNRAAYLVVTYPVSTPTPANDSIDAGEESTSGISAQIWLWEDGRNRQLGEIESCIEEYQWTKDERHLIAIAAPIPADCQETFAWHVDLNTGEVTSLLPKSEYGADTVVYGISPDDKNLLFKSSDIFSILNLSSMLVTQLETPKKAHGVWVSNNALMVSYRKTADQPRSIGLLDIGTSKLTEIVSPEVTPELAGLWIGEVEMSPDMKWLAISTGHNIYDIEDLWLINLQSHHQTTP